MAHAKEPTDRNPANNQGSASSSGPKDLIIAEIGTEKTFPKGTIIVRQGDTPESFYVVRQGKVKVFRLSEEGIRTDLTELGEGAYFGELAIVTGQPRTASVEAGEDTILTEISREEFDILLDDNPPLARQIIKQLTQWLVEGDKRLEKQVVRQVKVREVSWFDFALIAGLSLIFALVFNFYNDNQIPLIQGLGGEPVKVISLEEALQKYQAGNLIVIDARKDGFYQQKHIKGAENFQAVFFDLMFPMFQFKLEQKQATPETPIFIYGGTLSRRFDLDLARALQKQGYENVMVLKDYDSWEKTFPVVEKPPKAPAAMHLGLAGIIERIPLSIFVFLLIPPVRRSPYLAVFCRLLLGVIFIQFALSKIMRPAVFALNVVEYQLMPGWGVNLWSLALPWAELLAGLFLILGIRTRTAAIFIGGMNIIFIVGLVNAILNNYPINCGCVGETGEPVNWWKVMKNVGMLPMTVQIFFYDRLFVLDRGGFVWREKKNMNRTICKWLPLVCLLLASLWLGSCGESRTPYVGHYKSNETIAGKGHIELMLRDNGEADWNWAEEGTSSKFKWRVQDGRIWLYTKEGVIIIATPGNGNKQLSVDISGEWHEGCPVEKCITFTRIK